MSIKSSISDYFKIDELKENLIKLIEAKFELKKLEVQEKIEGLISDIVVKIVMAAFLVLTPARSMACWTNSSSKTMLVRVSMVLLLFKEKAILYTFLVYISPSVGDQCTNCANKPCWYLAAIICKGVPLILLPWPSQPNSR